MRAFAILIALVLSLSACAESGRPILGNAPQEQAQDDTGYVFDDEPVPSEAPKAAPPEETVEEPSKLEDASEPEPEEAQENAEEEEVEETKPDPNAAARAKCERKDGSFAKTPKGFFLCVLNTGQGQKTCTSARDCKGACLARSGTCSPLNPLVGCHEVLTQNGSRQTICIE